MRIPVAASFLVAVFLLVACGGEAAPPEVPRPLSAEAERQREDDGAATLRSTVRIEFPEEIELVLEGQELRSAITIQTPGAAGAIRPQNVPIVSATVSRANPTVLVLETSELVPNNSELRIRRAALARGGEGSVAVTVRSDLTPIQVMLASRPMAPTRPELFTSGRVAPVTDQDRDEAAMRQALADHLDTRGTVGTTYERAMAYFDGMDPEVVRSPKLRAALAGLTGTFAEPAIEDLMTPNNCTAQRVHRIAFEEPPDFPDLLARVTYTETGARVISVNPTVEGEPFQLLMPILMHEAIHCDQVAEADEEVVATAFDTFFYILLIAAEPWLTQEGTVLARNFNVDAMALINSGRMVPESVGILPSPGGHPIFPGTELQYRSFAEYVRAAYSNLDPGPSPDEPLAQRYVMALAAPYDLPVQSAFNLVYLDGLLGWTMEPFIMFAAMDALGLEPLP
jgi:hypothetical protein